MLKRVIKKQNSGKDCFVCGVENSAGLKTSFYELEDGGRCCHSPALSSELSRQGARRCDNSAS